MAIQDQSGNPVLDEIDAAHASLSDPARQALESAHQASIRSALGGIPGGLPEGTPALPATAGMSVPDAGPPIQASAPAGPKLAATVGEAPVPMPKFESPSMGRLRTLEASPNGIQGKVSQIHNPFLRGLAQVGGTAADVIASGIFPNFGRYVPGTSAHHGLLVHQAQNAVANEQNEANQEAALNKNQADVAKTNAETATLNSATVDPETQAFEHFTSQGMDPATAYGKIIELKNGGKVPKESNPELQAYDALVKKGVDPVEAYRQVKTVGQTEKPEQLDRQYEDLLAKRLRGKELTPQEQAQMEAYKQRKLLVPSAQNTFRIEQGGEKNDKATRAAAFKAYQPALDSGERFNVMSKNYEDAIKNHDQQAMLSLLANHLGMTMSLQKGARLTKDIIHEAEQSRPWLQGLNAKFDSDGYLTGVNLTPEQMRQMVSLGRERFREDTVKAGSEARYLGATDEGPDRIPNRSTMNHYLAQTNGDVARAKAMAKEDGWTVK